MENARLLLTLCCAVFIAAAVQSYAESASDRDMVVSCYSGIAVLRLKPGPNVCQVRSKGLLPLTAPMDFSTDLPWDCLESLLVSVEGCKISMIPMKNTSALLPDFACNWLEYQGYVESAYAGRLALWTRAVPAAKWVLYNTNLTSWRKQGVSTVTFNDLQAAITAISRRAPRLPLADLMKQPEITALAAPARNFQQQQQMSADDIAAAIAAIAAQQQQTAAGGSGGGRRMLQQQPAAAAAAPTAPTAPAGGGKPPSPPGVEADVVDGLASDPIGWQKVLADIYQSNGSPIYGDLVSNTILLFNNQRCNLTYEVVSGGLLGVGTPDQTSVGKFALNSIDPYELPYMLEVNRDVLAAAAGDTPRTGPFRNANIALVTILAVLGAVLLAALIFLAVRLARAPKAAMGSGPIPFDDGVGQTGAIAMSPLDGAHRRAAVSPLEQQAATHGPTGGI